MMAFIATRAMVVRTGGAMQPSEMANFVTSSLSTQVLMFRVMIAISSEKTMAVNQIFLSKTATKESTKTIRPRGSMKNKPRSSNWVIGP